MKLQETYNNLIDNTTINDLKKFLDYENKNNIEIITKNIWNNSPILCGKNNIEKILEDLRSKNITVLYSNNISGIYLSTYKKMTSGYTCRKIEIIDSIIKLPGNVKQVFIHNVEPGDDYNKDGKDDSCKWYLRVHFNNEEYPFVN